MKEGRVGVLIGILKDFELGCVKEMTGFAVRSVLFLK
jgi:hypothetical protein